MIGPVELNAPFSNATIPVMIDQIIGKEEMSRELIESLELVRLNRAFDCPSYNECLLYAAKKTWKGFTCKMCDKFHEHLR